MSLKLLYNITTWPNREINYWGIPKCGNTSIKYALMEKRPPLSEPLQSNDWIHQEGRATYIDPQAALNNGYWNFTVIRDPISRVVSLYNDFFIKRKGRFIYDSSVNDFQTFIEYLANTQDIPSTDIHFRSQTSFIRPAIEKIFIGKLEHIDMVTTVVNQHNKGEPIVIPTTHTTGYPLEVTAAQKRLILKRYNDDFCLYANILTRSELK